ncbi:YggT family protein [Candidatus Neptunochlamydia vexilliferae]|uniref:Membrane protein YlmG n=1 Tax=Candidatus Neptunichlamydia vexilliferae TaxID=1651774 RepID=A0ABS0AZ90_9BACT|nr:YggT family protein [Candidatus Neptunochlamydia vexilliferae]MBF5059444.1 putative membrane protein YlmG [Candidatus Neptunochlamydia vexilliferae]
MSYLLYAVRLLFTVYSLMLIIRIFGSWFPRFQQSSFFRFVAHYTDPYLNIFRRFIPPIGGVLDLSPLLGFFVLQLLERGITYLLLLI